MDMTDINSAARSNKPIGDGYKLLASGDDFGKVNLYRYPSMIERSEALKMEGHSSHVTSVRFTSDDKYLISAGGNDTAVCQWKISEE
jgi:WD40 repeat protein